MSEELAGKRVAFLIANEGVEQIELTEPLEAVREAGAQADLLAPEAGQAQAFNHLDKADTFEVEAVAGADPADYDALVLPGGVICHGPWTLIEADVVRGRTLTSWPSLRTDLRNAGAEWVDEEVHVDNGLVSSRNPDDLDAFKAKVVEEIAEGVHEGQRAAA